jgi:hypothetical protein
VPTTKPRKSGNSRPATSKSRASDSGAATVAKSAAAATLGTAVGALAGRAIIVSRTRRKKASGRAKQAAEILS